MRSPLRAATLVAALALATAAAPAHAAGSTPFPSKLPRGKTLKGVWSLVGQGEGYATSAISFQWPLAKTPKIVVVPQGTDATASGCPGTVADPKARRGLLCVFAGFTTNLGKFGSIGPTNGTLMQADRHGVILFAQGGDATQAFAVHGTYAVTGN